MLDFIKLKIRVEWNAAQPKQRFLFFMLVIPVSVLCIVLLPLAVGIIISFLISNQWK